MQSNGRVFKGREEIAASTFFASCSSWRKPPIPGVSERFARSAI
jgi:hypothetical protein